MSLIYYITFNLASYDMALIEVIRHLFIIFSQVSSLSFQQSVIHPHTFLQIYSTREKERVREKDGKCWSFFPTSHTADSMSLLPPVILSACNPRSPGNFILKTWLEMLTAIFFFLTIPGRKWLPVRILITSETGITAQSKFH